MKFGSYFVDHSVDMENCLGLWCGVELA